ncbi:BlaI family penicillinase repressor [Dysgonomonas sp. PFB1-18]|uniref:BlaI/MecI/CopY family transcriptional regulator n=1 Tax=unclassified Dysgonomonas TaxID=2630389 RepID=UPI00247487C1|nr:MULTISPECIES: BlaI/MecI/CopY family transcriptional regulator [unclassified Dysgonomonas]MDH6310741.1 BlaI family penicillinase repressor [Dysgonomonas sp. PF1-14]MDH6340591.1 BlaI family penicillinase repressor [Dysgonomonas sp. PF1-16]MDH6382152.1 BlaI family penicillinase repressor [Dysgonomonas sp. PFB1-18]MDH6399496.1 BlaI family penicillinase repressor [Dysgonomonas sp. PF1-23]
MEKLTHQEESVMLHIWQLKECVVKDIVNEMEEPRPPYTTVASIVRNLDQKGYLNSKKYGNVWVYSPRIDEDEYKKTFMSDVVKSYFENSYKELVSFFAKEEKISPDELLEIVKMIEKGKS